MSDFPKKKEIAVPELNDQIILVTSTNGKKTNAIKFELIKQKDSLVIECYSLNRGSKENVLQPITPLASIV